MSRQSPRFMILAAGVLMAQLIGCVSGVRQAVENGHAVNSARASAENGWTGALPQGAGGIAARYALGKGIENDPQVIFADDFESYKNIGDMSARWNAGLFHHLRLSAEPGNSYSGRQALEFTSPRQNEELSNQAARYLKPEEDVVFLRFYSKFEDSFDVEGSCHNGGGVSAHYFINGAATPGIKADGRNKFLVHLEAWRDDASQPNPGKLNLYVYHPEQRSEWGDHLFPDGVTLPNSSQQADFGAEFTPRPNVVPALGRWHCYELMVKANHAGKRDGRMAWWLDGVLAADYGNIRLRDVESLKMDRIDLMMHIKSNPKHETRKWFDNVVVARSYIGPMTDPARKN